jgi:hypothetical protein
MLMNRKYGVLMTALLTVGSTVYANEISFDPEEEMIPPEGSDTAEEFLNRLPIFGPIAAKGLISVDVNKNDDNPIYIKNVIDFKTTGESMAEFLVTVKGADGEVTTTWVANSTERCKSGGYPAERGIAAADNWSLEVCDTWRKRWVLTASGEGITSIEIEPIIDIEGDGNAAVFDVIIGKGPESTTGSSNGREINNVKGSFSDIVTATYSRPVHLFGEEEKHDLYGVLTLYFGDTPFIGTMVFRADTDDVELPKGCCCLDFNLEGFDGYDGNFPASLNNDGNNIHFLPGSEPKTNHIDKFLVCYDRRYPTQLACESVLGKTKKIPFPDQRKEVDSTHWFINEDQSDLWCGELKEEPNPFLPFDVPNLAKGVKLKAKKNKDGGVDLTLTTNSEKDTATFAILRGDKLDNGGTAIKTVPTCSFPSGGSPYTCTDKVAGDNYRAFEIEDTGRLIVYEPVTVK